MKANIDYTLYVCTDRRLMSSTTIEESVAEAIRGGATLIQYREKGASGRRLYKTARAIKAVTERGQVPLIINDRLDIAMAVDAAGVHLGQRDIPVREARKILGKEKIIGVSAANAEEAVQAVSDGADYIGVGAMFATVTKTNTRPVTMETLAAIRAGVQVPIVVIGGINRQNASLFADMGIDGLAVVSAVIAQPDVRQAAVELRQWKRRYR